MILIGFHNDIIWEIQTSKDFLRLTTTFPPDAEHWQDSPRDRSQMLWSQITFETRYNPNLEMLGNAATTRALL